MRVHPSIRLAAVVTVVTLLAAPAAAQDRSALWRSLAQSLTPGVRVELDLANGTHVLGTLLATSNDSLVVNPRTRIPVAPWTIDYTEIASLDVKPGRDGMSPGVKVLIGGGVAAAVFLVTGFLILLASD